MNPAPAMLLWGYPSQDGPDLTWIGPTSLIRNGVCLGFDNGGIQFVDSQSWQFQSRLVNISRSNEAVNGVASIGQKSLAVSTRSEITFIEMDAPPRDSRAVFPGGAHGLLATQSGYFVASLGIGGLLFIKPENALEQKMHLSTGDEGQLYFYRMGLVYDRAGREFLIFANRKDGLGYSEFREEKHSRVIHTISFPGVDVVDVCGMAPGSLSVIAISTNGELLWCGDISRPEAPLAFKLGGVRGRIYRVLAAANDLFVLTSQALYIFPQFANDLLTRGTFPAKTDPIVKPMDAVDISLLDDKTLLIVMASNLFGKLDITNLGMPPSFPLTLSSSPSTIEPTTQSDSPMDDFSPIAEIRQIMPAWERHAIHQSDTQQELAAV